MKHPRKSREPRVSARKKARDETAALEAAAAADERTFDPAKDDPEGAAPLKDEPDGEYSDRIAEYLIERDLIPAVETDDVAADDEPDEPVPLTTLRAIREMENYLESETAGDKDVDGFLAYLEANGIR